MQEVRIMKVTYFSIIVLQMIMTWIYSLSYQNQKSVPSDFLVNHKQSELLIDRFNALRQVENLQHIEHDTVLDDIGKVLLTDKTKIYRKSTNVYNEDSVRLLFYNKGIIDYQYEIKEMSDRDTASVFKDFVLEDKWNHIRAGYYRTENRHILLKTKSYLKCVSVVGSSHCDPISPTIGSNLSSIQESRCYTDSLIYYFKILVPDTFYYQFHAKLPLSNEKVEEVQKKRVQMVSGKSSICGEYDFFIKSTGQQTNMFLSVLNKENQSVVVVK